MEFQIQNLTKRFGTNIIFNEINLDIQAGELIHLQGKNGSGKSTLFKMMIGDERYQSGSILSSDDVYVGALIENPHFFEYENAENNLRYLANIRGSFETTTARELCTLFDIDLDGKTRVHHFSVGMREKMGIIQAVMENQNLVLLDEPTRGLDQDSIVKFAHLVNEIVAEGRTVIIASHDHIPGINFSRNYVVADGELKRVNS